VTYLTHLSDGAIDALLAHDRRGRPSAWTRTAKGNLWRRWGAFRVVVFGHQDAPARLPGSQGRYGWLVARHRPAGTPAFCPTTYATYATERDATRAATDAVTVPRRG